MANSTSFAFENTQATLDGQSVQGLWEGDDVIMVEPNSSKTQTMVGADGSTVTSVNADNTALITLKLQHTSPTHRLLEQRLKTLESSGRVIFMTFDVIDTRSGEGGTAERCVVEQQSSTGFGVNATQREWTIKCMRWNRHIPNEVQN